MKYSALLSFSVLSLSLAGCAFVQDSSIQDIEIRTPGAEGTVCMVYVNKLEYKVRPPTTLNVSKSKEDLVIDCLAPGNRRKEVYIGAQINPAVYGNAITAGVTAAWDSLSGAAYIYPSLIEVSFENIPPRPEELPMHDRINKQILEGHKLEEFNNAQPVLHRDSEVPTVPLKKKER